MMHKHANRNEAEGGKKKVGLVGARGYSGVELARLLLRHPQANLVTCFAGKESFSLSDYLPEASARAINIAPLEDLEAHLDSLDVIFLATPAEVSLELAPRILKGGKVDVVDLSGAFRLENAADYKKWYALDHQTPALLSKAHYGLAPFSDLRPGSGRLVANPGCYATAVLMALIPLLRAGVIDPHTLVIDAKSGTSGGGRKATENLLFTEVDGECLPYRVGKHQHLPEIQRWAEALGGFAVDPFFTTSLLPLRRGIIAGLYAKLKPGKTEGDITEAFRNSYEGYPLVRFGKKEGFPLEQTIAQPTSLRKVVGTARCHLEFSVIGDKLYLFSLLDNLLKGAASQAIENFNALGGAPLGLGLEDLEGSL